MFSTRAAKLRTAGVAAGVLATSVILLGVTGPARADATLRSFYCYKNETGNNPDRIYVYNVVDHGPATDDTHYLTVTEEMQYWGLNTYTNPTNASSPGSLGPLPKNEVDAIASNVNFACTRLSANASYQYGAWA